MQPRTYLQALTVAFILLLTHNHHAKAETSAEFAQGISALLIAPTTWAGDIAQAKNARPAICNSLLILADINRIVQDALMYHNEQTIEGIHNAGNWLASTASLNLYLLAEHIIALKNGTMPAKASLFTSINKFGDAALAAGKITLPLLESMCSLMIIDLKHDYESQTIAKFGKNLAQHINQLLHCNHEERAKIVACVVALFADFYTKDNSDKLIQHAWKKKEQARAWEEQEARAWEQEARAWEEQARAWEEQEARAWEERRRSRDSWTGTWAEQQQRSQAQRAREEQEQQRSQAQRAREEQEQQRSQAQRAWAERNQVSEQNHDTVALRKNLAAAKRAKAAGTATPEQLDLLNDAAKARNKPAGR